MYLKNSFLKVIKLVSQFQLILLQLSKGDLTLASSFLAPSVGRQTRSRSAQDGLETSAQGSVTLLTTTHLVEALVFPVSFPDDSSCFCQRSPGAPRSLIILGFARLISTSSVNYQVHVGEYGVHWNFFFTLAAVAILTFIINVHPNYCGILGSLILIGYQALLLCGLNKFIMSEERKPDIFSQNKEGIFSIFGYWGMYLVGVRIGSYLFFGGNADATLKTKKWAATRVWALCLFFWLITLLLDWYVEAVSRRMCNLAYVTFTLAANLQVLAILMLSHYVSGCKSSALEEAFNRNLLTSFLLANVLTGLVNLSIDTLSASSIFAVAILFAYAFVLSLSVGFADFFGIKLKFW
ncbi:PREDICTED: uncharacterized protein At4g17910-like [Erythranthe guttata]|nr:PREDICTED: uncharacterized protein At4g17910-like [Erythranthe guttata]|eukprot:XP_012833307.1 PREDICTED: uncharacterized protein At4g17910-like [Erythranthe guttata]